MIADLVAFLLPALACTWGPDQKAMSEGPLMAFSFDAQTTGLYIVNFDNLSSANQQTIEYSLIHSTFSRTLSLAATIIGVILLIAGITTFTIKKTHS